MNEQTSGGNGGDGEEKPGQGHRGAEQMGTHGGPSRSGNGGRGEGPHTDPQAPGRPAGGTGSHGGGPSEKHETSGHPGSSSEAEAAKDEPSPGEREGMAAQAASRVKSLARGLMEKAADVVQTGLQTAEEKLDEMAKAAPKIQERFARQKASKVTRGKTGKPDLGRKSVRGGRNKADRAGKVGGRGKAGRKAAAKGARKGTMGGRKKQTGRAAGKGDRRSALRGPGSPGQGRTSAKGGRGKTGGARRPSPRGGASRAKRARRGSR